LTKIKYYSDYSLVWWENFSSFDCKALVSVMANKCAKYAFGCLFTMRHNGLRVGDVAFFAPHVRGQGNIAYTLLGDVNEYS